MAQNKARHISDHRRIAASKRGAMVKMRHPYSKYRSAPHALEVIVRLAGRGGGYSDSILPDLWIPNPNLYRQHELIHQRDGLVHRRVAMSRSWTPCVQVQLSMLCGPTLGSSDSFASESGNPARFSKRTKAGIHPYI